MGLCAVMNRCAAVEGGAEGGEGDEVEWIGWIEACGDGWELFQERRIACEWVEGTWDTLSWRWVFREVSSQCD